MCFGMVHAKFLGRIFEWSIKNIKKHADTKVNKICWFPKLSVWQVQVQWFSWNHKKIIPWSKVCGNLAQKMSKLCTILHLSPFWNTKISMVMWGGDTLHPSPKMAMGGTLHQYKFTMWRFINFNQGSPIYTITAITSILIITRWIWKWLWINLHLWWPFRRLPVILPHCIYLVKHRLHVVHLNHHQVPETCQVLRGRYLASLHWVVLKLDWEQDENIWLF